MQSVDFDTADELEHISKFKKKKKSSAQAIEAPEDIRKPHRDKKQKEKPTDFDLYSLNSTLDDLTAWQIDVDQKNKYFQTHVKIYISLSVQCS